MIGISLALSPGNPCISQNGSTPLGFGSLKINSQTVRLNGSRIIIPNGGARG